MQDATSTTQVAVLGLGTMGGRAAARLAEAGFVVHGYDPAPAARERATGQGVRVHPAAEDAVAAAEVVLLSLPGPAQVTAAAAGPLTAAGSGTVVADMSTIDPDTARNAAAALANAGVTYLDAPVLGRPDRCGRWTLPVGGPQSAVSRVAAVAEGTIAARVVRTGDVGAGSAIKLLNNLMFGAINAVTAEALNLCRLSDVDPGLFVDTLADSGAAPVSGLFRELGPKIVDADYSPTFGLGLLHKDNRLALELAQRVGGPSFVASCVDQVNSLAMGRGVADQDTGIVYELYRSLSPGDESAR